MSDASDPPDPASSVYLCPNCGQRVSATAGAARNVATCPQCLRDFFIGSEDVEGATLIEDHAEMVTPPDSRDDAFDQFRIRQTVILRRGLYRSRSYALIASVACAGAAAQCAYLAYQQVRAAGWDVRAVLFVLLCLAGIFGSVWFAIRTRALHREAKRSTLPETTTPPDFSALSDGSQRARDLDQIR